MANQAQDLGSVPVLILAGGQGTRLSEETGLRPKPMVEIGGRPILWHIMMSYSAFGFRNFVVCAGHLSHVVKDYFINLNWHDQDIEVSYSVGSGGKVSVLGEHRHPYEDWRVRIIDTGNETMTGARVARTLDRIGIAPDQNFALTYGDGLCDADLQDEYEFHLRSGKIGTVMGVHPTARFGTLGISEGALVQDFAEKRQTAHDLINGGFFFFKGAMREYLSTDSGCVLEQEPLVELARARELQVYRHEGFWQCMDTLRDKKILETEWTRPNCAWRKWKT
jgi:glucose-1-phosphate cytidylyltransferase